MYLLEFNLQVLHCSEKSHTISDALSWLFNKNIINVFKNAFNIEVFYMFIEFIIAMSEDFHK